MAVPRARAESRLEAESVLERRVESHRAPHSDQIYAERAGCIDEAKQSVQHLCRCLSVHQKTRNGTMTVRCTMDTQLLAKEATAHVGCLVNAGGMRKPSNSNPTQRILLEGRTHGAIDAVPSPIRGYHEDIGVATIDTDTLLAVLVRCLLLTVLWVLVDLAYGRWSRFFGFLVPALYRDSCFHVRPIPRFLFW